jgi:hypothetical protein
VSNVITIHTTSHTWRQATCRSLFAALLVVIMFMVPGSSAAAAQTSPVLSLCPATIVNTCVIGYVSAPSKLVIMLSSMDNDPLVGGEVEVATTSPNVAVKMLDLSAHVGSVVMLDAIGSDRLYAAKLVSVADPLLTALYLSMYMQPLPNGAAPQ